MIDTRQLENLPIARTISSSSWRSRPASIGTRRLGGGGQDTYMIDGVSAMDTGNNGCSAV